MKKIDLQPAPEISPADNMLPGLQLLFDFSQVKRILEKNALNASVRILECRGKYVRYKPATNCILAYSAKYVKDNCTGPFNLMFYAKCYSTEDFSIAAAKINSHEWHNIQDFKPVVALADERVIFYVFPNDCEMKELAKVTDARKIARMLYDIEGFLSRDDWRISDKRLKIEVIRYKPEKRAVVKIVSRAKNRLDQSKIPLTVYLRAYCTGGGKNIFHTMRDLSQSLQPHRHVQIPRALSYLEDKQYLFTEGLPGQPLADILDSADKSVLISQAAQALAVLHQAHNVRVTFRSSADLMDDAIATAATAKLILPEMSAVIQDILDKLNPLYNNKSDMPFGFVHGDFHTGQLLIKENSTAVLDFDRSFRGDSLVDVGNFCADLIITGRQKRWNDTPVLIDSFVKRYEKGRGLSIDRARLKLWTGFGLLLFSVYPFRSLKPDWKSEVSANLSECDRTLS